DRPDEEVAQMRPFELADLWGVDRRAALSLFLRATRAGLVDLRWQVNCPVCRVSAQVADGLAGVGSRVHCDACDVSYGVDFGRNVEAVFQSSPALRRVVPAVFCAASPSRRPHVFAQLTVAPATTRTESATLPLGELHARILRQEGGADLTLAHAPATLDVVVADEGVTMTAGGRSADGRTAVRVTSAAGAPRTVLLERSGWSAAEVTGAVVASFPDFLDLFATEAPATGVELSVGHLTVLFSDLTGSTALYERVGDARAFALVEEHFALVGAVIARHGGAVVKTMGDAVMATFATTEQGVRAAIEMVRAHDAKQGALGLGVKIGVHTGACLAVRANDRLDFFGGTVNLAARLQAQARASEVVITAEAARDPAVRELIGSLPTRAFEARLKGIGALRGLVGVDAGVSPGGATARAPGNGPHR
ncbi:MAG: Adenylate cyclase, partial [Myxococcaceae bacterium]|nr:Adenylate cyclase [Myxococcaceae bacterium]